MNDNPPLILRREGAIAHLRFNRPQSLNSIDSAATKALLAASNELAGDPTVRAVVLSGEGRAFCAGLDFGSFQAMAGDDRRGTDAVVTTPEGRLLGVVIRAELVGT